MNPAMQAGTLAGKTIVMSGGSRGVGLAIALRAAADGVVVTAGLNGNYGNYVRIDHGSRLATGYAHLSSIVSTLRPGTRVGQGEIIGFVAGQHEIVERMREESLKPTNSKNYPAEALGRSCT